MYNTGHYVQCMPKSVSIQQLASYFKKYVDKIKCICYFVKNFDFHEILK